MSQEDKLTAFTEALDDYVDGKIKAALDNHESGWHDDSGIPLGFTEYTSREQLQEVFAALFREMRQDLLRRPNVQP